MHYSLASLRLVLLAFAILPAAFAANIEDALQRRQGPSSPSPAASQTASATSSSPSPTASSTKTTSLSQSSGSSAPSPSITATPVPSPSVTPSTTQTATPTVITQTIISSATKQIVTTLETVDSSGSTVQQVLTTSGLVSVGTSVTTSTSFPGIGNNGESSGSSGLTSQQKKIIIGVVVGVGGFVILGGMALVAWRVWGRKKQPIEDDRAHTATPTGPGGSPFKSTLDQYHNPGAVNTASNF